MVLWSSEQLPQSAQAGFTLIEILMVVMLVGILSAFAIPQFIDFRGEASDAAIRSSLATMRTAIVNQQLQMRVRCGVTGSVFPTLAQLTNNNITQGGAPCTTAMIRNPNERAILASEIPKNIWGSAVDPDGIVACNGANTGCNQNDNTDCLGNSYTPSATGCTGATGSTGWCYNPATGQIWANSANSKGPQKEHLF